MGSTCYNADGQGASTRRENSAVGRDATQRVSAPPYLKELAQVTVPLQGLTIGRQLQRLKQLEGPFSKSQFD